MGQFIELFRNGYKKLEERLEEGMQISLSELKCELKKRGYQPIYSKDDKGNLYLEVENKDISKGRFYQVLIPIDIADLNTPQRIQLKRIEEQETIDYIVRETDPIFEISDFSATPTPMHPNRDRLIDGFVGVFRYQ